LVTVILGLEELGFAVRQRHVWAIAPCAVANPDAGIAEQRQHALLHAALRQAEAQGCRGTRLSGHRVALRSLTEPGPRTSGVPKSTTPAPGGRRRRWIQGSTSYSLPCVRLRLPPIQRVVMVVAVMQPCR